MKVKNEKGITLVALVITIIILIILASITINMAFGDGGLIQKAEQAKNLTEQATRNEQSALNSLMDEYDKIINGENGAEEEPDDEDKTVEYTDIYVTMYTDGTLALASTADAKLSGKEVKTEYGNVDYVAWSSEKENITNVIFIDAIVPSDTSRWFYNCEFLKSIENIENLNTSRVTDMSEMFNWCENLTNLDVSNFDTSNVTDMNRMFAGCSVTTLDLSNFDTSNVTDMSSMFNGCEELTNLDLSNFDTSNVTDMSSMFAITGLTTLDLSNFDTSNVTNMNRMFENCDGLTSLDLSNFDTSSVTDMSGMFGFNDNLTNIDLSSFDTGNVTDMGRMFYCCYDLTSLDLKNFNTSNVTDCLCITIIYK